jgi:hypothetical protein
VKSSVPRLVRVEDSKIGGRQENRWRTGMTAWGGLDQWQRWPSSNQGRGEGPRSPNRTVRCHGANSQKPAVPTGKCRSAGSSPQQTNLFCSLSPIPANPTLQRRCLPALLRYSSQIPIPGSILSRSDRPASNHTVIRPIHRTQFARLRLWPSCPGPTGHRPQSHHEEICSPQPSGTVAAWPNGSLRCAPITAWLEQHRMAPPITLCPGAAPAVR